MDNIETQTITFSRMHKGTYASYTLGSARGKLYLPVSLFPDGKAPGSLQISGLIPEADAVPVAAGEKAAEKAEKAREKAEAAQKKAEARAAKAREVAEKAAKAAEAALARAAKAQADAAAKNAPAAEGGEQPTI